MGYFDFLKQPDINQGIKQYKNTAGAMLLDVRTPQEYAGGHIPESLNIPLQELHRAADVVNQKDTPLFVHCLSGGRSRQADAVLKQIGYTNVTNIGGIADYNGKVEQ